MSMPNNRLDRGTGISSGSPIRKWFTISVMENDNRHLRKPLERLKRSEENIRVLNGGASCICIMHILSTVQPEIPPCGTTFLFSVSQILTIHFPSIPLPRVSYQFSYAHQSILFISNWPWHPPLSSGAATITSIGTPRHLYGYTPSYIYVYPSSYIILLFPLDNTTIVATRRASSFPPPLPGELGNPPARRARARLAPPLTYPGPISNPVLISPLDPIPRLQETHDLLICTPIAHHSASPRRLMYRLPASAPGTSSGT